MKEPFVNFFFLQKGVISFVVWSCVWGFSGVGIKGDGERGLYHDIIESLERQVCVRSCFIVWLFLFPCMIDRFSLCCSFSFLTCSTPHGKMYKSTGYLY